MNMPRTSDEIYCLNPSKKFHEECPGKAMQKQKNLDCNSYDKIWDASESN